MSSTNFFIVRFSWHCVKLFKITCIDLFALPQLIFYMRDVGVFNFAILFGWRIRPIINQSKNHNILDYSEIYDTATHVK